MHPAEDAVDDQSGRKAAEDREQHGRSLTIKVSAQAAQLFRAEGATAGARRDVCHARPIRIHRNNGQTVVNRRDIAAAATLVLAAAPALAQWVPSGPLAGVLVVQDAPRPPATLRSRASIRPRCTSARPSSRLVRQKDPGAEHFYFVHEFGHIALQTSDEAAADCWAAGELANAPHGERYLRAAIEHFRRRPDSRAGATERRPSARSGSGAARKRPGRRSRAAHNLAPCASSAACGTPASPPTAR